VATPDGTADGIAQATSGGLGQPFALGEADRDRTPSTRVLG
jgi:hypothetical protein